MEQLLEKLDTLRVLLETENLELSGEQHRDLWEALDHLVDTVDVIIINAGEDEQY